MVLMLGLVVVFVLGVVWLFSSWVLVLVNFLLLSMLWVCRLVSLLSFLVLFILGFFWF